MSFKLQEYPCAICNSKHYDKAYEVGSFKIVKCKDCSFAYVNPRVSNEDLPKLYSNNYFNNPEFGYLEYESTAHLRLLNFKRWIKEIKHLLPASGSVLDIGCASGQFLELMRENSWEVYGIELDWEMTSVLNSKNIPFFNKTFAEFETDKKFDLITMFDVIEHIPDLHNTFDKLNKLLKPGGVVALITPDYNSYQRKIFGAKWFQFKPLEHIHYFSLETLNKLSKEHGLSISYHNHPGQYADSDFLINRLSKYNFPSVARILKLLSKASGLNKRYLYIDTGSIFAVLKKD